MEKKLTLFAAIILGAWFAVSQTAFTVMESTQALVLQFGKPVADHTDPGLKVKIPFIQTVRVFEKRVLDVDPPPEEVILADQKRVVVDTFARYRIVNMLDFHTTLQTETQAESRLDTIINSKMRGHLGNATLSDILSEKRGDLMNAIRDDVNKDAKNFGIEIVDVRIGRADLPKQTSQSIYARMTAERQREAAEFRAQGQEISQQIKSTAEKERTVLLADAEKTAQILRGEGDKEAIRIYAEAFNKDTRFYDFYRSMEAYKAGLGNNNTTLILKPDSEFLRFLNEGRKD